MLLVNYRRVPSFISPNMKNQFKNIFGKLNRIVLALGVRNFSGKGSAFFRVRCKISPGNKVVFAKSVVEKVRISIKGTDNEIKSDSSLISSTSIQIEGTNNKLILEAGVKLRGSVINLRGNNCLIHIGQNTTFGGARLVNTGNDNPLKIGKNCLFADHIEVWASDTHSIYNREGKMINKEKPIIIEDNVWIGSHVFILKGVTIKSGSVVGMGALVTKDVPGNSISVGNPNAVVRENISWKLDY